MPPLPFRPLSRRSGRIPALPYPPLSLGLRLRQSPEILKLCVNRRYVSDSVVTGWASYGRVYLGAYVPDAQRDFGIGDPVIGGGPALE